MSIIEEALQRKAEEENGGNNQQEKGVGNTPPVIPHRGPKGQKRGPLFWIIVVLLVIGISLVSGIASYLYIFGGSVSDLAYLMPVSKEESKVQPEAFNEPVKGPTPAPAKADNNPNPKQETKAELSKNESPRNDTVEQGTSPANGTPAAEGLKSPWRVLTAKKENASGNVNAEVTATANTGSKENKSIGSEASTPPIQTARVPKGENSAKEVSPKTTQKAPLMQEETHIKKARALVIPKQEEAEPKRAKRKQKGAESYKKAVTGIAEKPSPLGTKREPSPRQVAEPSQKPVAFEHGSSEEQLQPPPWQGEKTTQAKEEKNLNVSATEEAPHPYYQEEPVNEIPPGQESGISVTTAPKPDTKKVVDKYLRLAIDLQERGEDTRAIELYRKVLKKEPNNVAAMNNLASIYLKKGMIWRASPLIEKAFSIAPDKVEVITNKAFLEFKRGHYFLAEGLWNEVLGINPSYVPAMLGLGTLYLAEGCPTDAQRILSQAFELDSNNPKVIYNLALAMDNCGRYQEAMSLYKELLKHSKALPSSLIAKVARRFYELQKSREGTGVEAMKREKGTW